MDRFPLCKNLSRGPSLQIIYIRLDWIRIGGKVLLQITHNSLNLIFMCTYHEANILVVVKLACGLLLLLFGGPSLRATVPLITSGKEEKRF